MMSIEDSDSREQKLLGICAFLRDQIRVYDAYLQIAANEEKDFYLQVAIEGLADSSRAAMTGWLRLPAPEKVADPRHLVERLLNQRPWSEQLIKEAQAFCSTPPER